MRNQPEEQADAGDCPPHRSRSSMAGEFAKTIGAEKLVLNHIGGRFPAPRRDFDTRMHVMREMERQATEAWGSGLSRAPTPFHLSTAIQVKF